MQRRIHARLQAGVLNKVRVGAASQLVRQQHSGKEAILVFEVFIILVLVLPLQGMKSM